MRRRHKRTDMDKEQIKLLNPTVHSVAQPDAVNYEMQTRNALPDVKVGDGVTLSRNFLSEVVSVGTSATLIKQASEAHTYMIRHATLTNLVTSSVTGVASAAYNTGAHTQASAIGVSNYISAHLYFNVTAFSASGVFRVTAQSYDALSGNWFNTQVVFDNISATGQYYAYMGSFGVATQLAFLFTRVSGTGTITGSIGVTLKEGLAGSSLGVDDTVYLGNSSAVNSTHGYPLFPGDEKVFILQEGAALYGIAGVATNIKILSL